MAKKAAAKAPGPDHKFWTPEERRERLDDLEKAEARLDVSNPGWRDTAAGKTLAIERMKIEYGMHPYNDAPPYPEYVDPYFAWGILRLANFMGGRKWSLEAWLALANRPFTRKPKPIEPKAEAGSGTRGRR